MTIEALTAEFAEQQRLPNTFQETAGQYFWPLLQRLEKGVLHSQSPLLVGIHGCQGSGKSTLADFIEFVFSHHFKLPCVGMSLDDFYLTRAERSRLAQEVHPLLATRGVPGTHDTSLLKEAIARLKAGNCNADELSIPRFNKALDERCPATEWTLVTTPPRLIILEGWCLGSPAQSSAELATPINDLERLHDRGQQWRNYVNGQLAEQYKSIFAELDCLVMLQAPGFHTVRRWRLEQEQRLVVKLKKEGKPTTHALGEAEINQFVQHFERITRTSLEQLPARADIVFALDEARQVVRAEGLD